VAPIGEYVVKVAGSCNLSCDYCYVYTMADQSWRGRPAFPAPPTVEATARRIGEHAREHGLSTVSVVLHGGEPLLAGRSRIDHVASTVRAACAPDVEVDLRLQTNGVLLDDSWLPVLRAHRFRVGVSIDGAQVHHDRHRVHRDGRGSHEETALGLRLLQENPDLYAGLLCVIDLANDPVDVYESLLPFEPPTIDFMLPLGNWTVPPPRRGEGDTGTPYGDWLVAIFDRWYRAPRRETAVRLFGEVIHLLLGGRSRSDQIGLSPVAYLVVDTDGSFQQADMLKSAAPGQPETGMTVFDHPVDAVLGHPEVRARQQGLASLADECVRCPLVRVCGGGNYTHRYRVGNGFRNRSVYCHDLQRLISHIATEVRADLGTLSAR
jgi:uncharacterized protein